MLLGMHESAFCLLSLSPPQGLLSSFLKLIEKTHKTREEVINNLAKTELGKILQLPMNSTLCISKERGQPCLLNLNTLYIHTHIGSVADRWHFR